MTESDPRSVHERLDDLETRVADLEADSDSTAENPDDDELA